MTSTPTIRYRSTLPACCNANLAAPSRLCQLSALHGLNHLQTPVAEEVVLNFLRDQAPDLDEELRLVADAALAHGLL